MDTRWETFMRTKVRVRVRVRVRVGLVVLEPSYQLKWH